MIVDVVEPQKVPRGLSIPISWIVSRIAIIPLINAKLLYRLVTKDLIDGIFNAMLSVTQPDISTGLLHC